MRFDYDMIDCDPTTTYTIAYITIAIDYDDYDEKLTCSFFARVESRRMEQARAIRLSRIVVVLSPGSICIVVESQL